MTIYVDEIRSLVKITHGLKGLHNAGCHMMAESDAELEAMAKRLRLRKDWKHGDHYDLSPNKRKQACAAGAVEVTSRELVRLRRRLAEPREPRKAE